MDLLGAAVLTLVGFAAGFLTRANISRRRRAAARRIRGDSWRPQRSTRPWFEKPNGKPGQIRVQTGVS